MAKKSHDRPVERVYDGNATKEQCRHCLCPRTDIQGGKWRNGDKSLAEAANRTRVSTMKSKGRRSATIPLRRL